MAGLTCSILVKKSKLTSISITKTPSTLSQYKFSIRLFKQLLPTFLFCLLCSPAYSQFGPKILIDSSNTASDVVTVDLNGDNLLDIAVSERYLGNRVSYSLNLGNGNMDTLVEIMPFYQPFEIEAADMIGSSQPDLVAIQGNSPFGNITIIENNFPGFTETIIDSVTYLIDFKLADMDQNGHTDIIVAGGDELFILYNDGLSGFTKTPIAMASFENYALEVADLNNDSFPEVIVGVIGLFIYANNNGVVTYDSLASASSSSGNPSIVHVEAGDVNNDGFTDVAYYTPPKVIVDTVQNGLLGYYAKIDSGNCKQNFVLRDLNGDGSLDYLSQRSPTNEIFWKSQTTPGVFSSKILIHQGDFRSARVFAGDLNGDQMPEVIWCNELAYHLNGFSVNLPAPTALPELHSYPNPSNGKFHIDAPETGELFIFDLAGKLCETHDFHQPGQHLIRTDLPEGLYILHHRGESGKRYTQKLWIGY